MISSMQRGFMTVVVVTSLAGCASPGFKAMDSNLKSQVSATQVVVGLGQSEIYVAMPPPTYAGGGLIGALIGSAIDNSHANTAEKEVVPLRNALVDYDFESQIKGDMQAELAKVDWLHMGSLTVSKAVDAGAYDQIVTTSQEPYVLIVTTDYHLTVDTTQLIVTVHAMLYPKQPPAPAPNTKEAQTYHKPPSDPSHAVFVNTVTYVASMPSNVGTEADIAYWSLDNGTAARAALTAAASEVSRLLAMSLQSGSQFGSVPDDVKVANETGHILEHEAGNRVVVAFDDGTLESTDNWAAFKPATTAR